VWWLNPIISNMWEDKMEDCDPRSAWAKSMRLFLKNN
jgi:hypothetical protein